jgi:hypothetical protein
MNYNRIYNNLITIAQNRSFLPSVYYEKHHIIPVCVGGPNEMSNLVKLTAEEHFVAHQLLVKIYPSESKLVFAVRYMCFGNSKNNGRTNNKMFAWLRNKHAKAMKEINTGRKQTQESNDKRSKSTKGISRPSLTQESIAKRTATRKLRNSGSKRKPCTQETKDLLSSYNLSLPELKCLHCDMVSRNKGNMRRYHNYFCKHRQHEHESLFVSSLSESLMDVIPSTRQ